MGSPPKNKKRRQNPRSNGSPKDNKNHHRIEAKSYAFLSLWIFADFLVIFGHVSIAAWTFYFVMVTGLGLFTNHAIKGWPTRKKIFSWSYVGLCLLLPLLLFFFTRQPETQKPDFKLFFWSLDSRKVELELPKDLFSSKIASFDFSGSHELMLIPLNANRSNVSLAFSLVNNSPVDADNIELIVSSNKKLGFIPNSSWIFNQGSEFDTNGQSFMAEIRQIKSFDGTMLHFDFNPEIYDESNAVGWPFAMYIRADNMQPIVFKWWFSFCVATNFSTPIFLNSSFSESESKKHGFRFRNTDEPTNRPEFFEVPTK